MRNIECKICGEIVINSLQKELKKRIYWSIECEDIPFLLHIWWEVEKINNSIFFTTPIKR